MGQIIGLSALERNQVCLASGILANLRVPDKIKGAQRRANGVVDFVCAVATMYALALTSQTKQTSKMSDKLPIWLRMTLCLNLALDVASGGQTPNNNCKSRAPSRRWL